LSYKKTDVDNNKAPAKAAELGLELVVPDDNTLTIDLDSKVVPTSYFDAERLLEKFYPIVKRRFTISKSGNYHVYLTFDKRFTITERIALQAILGSDPARELLSLVRAKEGDQGEPIVMFEVPRPAAGEEAA
jgi:hypothetical protein